MSSFVVRPLPYLKGIVSVPGDKSIAHRSLILSAIALGTTKINNFPANNDCLFTLEAFRRLGVKIKYNRQEETLTVSGKGLSGLKAPVRPIFVGESGTTLRLLLGVLAGCGFTAKLKAAKSLSKRPMLRVTAPLRMMGAEISASHLPGGRTEEYPPLTIKGGGLKPISYKMPVASAQVKSAILLAALFAEGDTTVLETVKTRDHTERLLKLFKAEVKVKGNKIVVKGSPKLLSPRVITVPGDISSAAFFMVLAAILPDASITIKNVSLNPSRSGVIRVLKRMGACISISAADTGFSKFEPMGSVTVKSGPLRATVVKKEEIPSLIDELPVLMVAAANAKGRSIFEGVQELRVKETDRIESMTENLSRMGVSVKAVRTARSEKIIVEGAKQLIGTKVRSFGDHRTAMSMIIAGMNAKGPTLIDDVGCISKSFPGFLSALKGLSRSQ
ncbi:MAG: 3-phosphoshikimate 1-carboxyvinyltransferase [Candidatus Omnitrophica bacterium]|nr:3-phosphoshikimate 1-carboxyvinyltransferase [Candidatus Omnitrophota bacterium]